MLDPKDYHYFEKYFYFLFIIREFFKSKGYTEVYTPIIVPCPGTEVHLEYFSTYWKDYNNRSHKFFLRSSPEIHLKKLLALGFKKIFEIAPSFRNCGECNTWHNPEFLMLEWYEVGISFEDFINQTQELLRFTYEKMKQQYPDDVRVQFAEHIPKFSLKEAFKKFANLDLIDEDADLAKKAKSVGILSVSEHDDFESAFFKILIERIEPQIEKIGFCVLYDYPASQAALSCIQNGWAKRFEFYYKRIELCNAFLELIDPNENRQRIKNSIQKRKLLKKSTIKEDKDFYSLLDKTGGLLPSCGNALGLDRWFSIIFGYNYLIIPKLWGIFHDIN